MYYVVGQIRNSYNLQLGQHLEPGIWSHIDTGKVRTNHSYSQPEPIQNTRINSEEYQNQNHLRDQECLVECATTIPDYTDRSHPQV